MTDYDKQRAEEILKASNIREKMKKALVIAGFTVAKRDEDESAWNCIASGKTPDGTASVYMHTSAYKKWRIEVNGEYPKTQKGEWVTPYYSTEEQKLRREGRLPIGEYGRVIRPSITVSSDKTPEAIARDVLNRFMPAYADYRQRCQYLVNEADNYAGTTRASLVAVKGSALTEHEEASRGFSVYGDDLHYGVKANGRHIDIKIDDIDAETAKAIIALVKEPRSAGK